MRRQCLFSAILIVLAAGGCRGRSEEPPKAANGSKAGTARAGVSRETTAVTCPECAGLGRSPHSGDDRPCFLCDGDGRCALCGGQGRHRDGTCTSCEGSARCVDCGGDGMISSSAHDPGFQSAPVSGSCPLCVASRGYCPDCGGHGRLRGARPCFRCGGQSWCPECRGSGANRLCAGEGICPLCRGRGALQNGDPAPGLPTLTLHLVAGERIEARLLAPPSRMLTFERLAAAGVGREAISLDAVAAADVLLAFRLFAAPDAPTLRIASARYLLTASPLFLSAARHDALAARAAGASTSEVDLILARIDDLQATWFLEQARNVLDMDPERAFALLQTHRHAFPRSEDAAEAERLLGELAKAREKDESARTADVRERRRVAEVERVRRLARRGEEWRVRAENLLARPGATSDDFLRAHRAAFEAWLIFTRAANGAEPEIATTLQQNGTQVRALRIRALIGMAARLLQAGHVERARSLGMSALSLAPGDAGALQFVAEVEAALGRRAGEVDDR